MILRKCLHIDHDIPIELWKLSDTVTVITPDITTDITIYVQMVIINVFANAQTKHHFV